jgi:hypothetical protein
MQQKIRERLIRCERIGHPKILPSGWQVLCHTALLAVRLARIVTGLAKPGGGERHEHF